MELSILKKPIFNFDQFKVQEGNCVHNYDFYYSFKDKLRRFTKFKEPLFFSNRIL